MAGIGERRQKDVRGTTESNQRRTSRSMTKRYENFLFRIFRLFTVARHFLKVYMRVFHAESSGIRRLPL